MLLWCHFLWHLIYFSYCGIVGMRDQTVFPRTYQISICVYERERARVLLSVWSGKCMQQDGLPNIGWVRKTEAAAHSLLKTSGNRDFCAWRWKKWLEFCQMMAVPALDTGWKAAGWLFFYLLWSVHPRLLTKRLSLTCVDTSAAWHVNYY